MGNPIMLSQQRSLLAAGSGVPAAGFKGAFSERVRALNARDGAPLNARWASTVRRSVLPTAMVRGPVYRDQRKTTDLKFV